MMTNLKHLVLITMFSLMAAPASALMVEVPGIQGDYDPDPSAGSLERQYVEERLIESGVEPADAVQRVQRMTAAEVSQLYAQLDELPAGGVSTTNLLLIIIILILLL